MGLHDNCKGFLERSGILYLLFLGFMANSFDEYISQTVCRLNSSHFGNCINYEDKIIKEEINSVFENYTGILCNFGNFLKSEPICNFTKMNSTDLLRTSENVTNTSLCTRMSDQRLFQAKFLILIVPDKTITRTLFKGIIDNSSAQNRTLEDRKLKLQLKNHSNITVIEKTKINFIETYLSKLVDKYVKNQENCSGTIIYFIFPELNYIFQFADRRVQMQLSFYCGNPRFSSIDFYYSPNRIHTLNRLILTTKNFLEKYCTNYTKNATIIVNKTDDSSGAHVTILVPIVIIGFIVFSCILIMRFCQDGESTLMMRAKIMKYHPEKDKQLLALIYQQIHNEEQSQLATKTNATLCNSKKSKEKCSTDTIAVDVTKPWISGSQPCCSKDVISGHLVSTIACGLAPLKR